MDRYKNLNRNSIRVLIVTPTRELANQVYSIASKLIKVSWSNRLDHS